MSRPFYKVIACEIAFREISHVAARSPSLLDTEFITQGLHDTPIPGCGVLRERIQAVPAGKYDAILLGYGLCGNLIRGLTTGHTPLVVPRAHDCITFFLGSKERYAERSRTAVGTYYYTSGWLECLQRRGLKSTPSNAGFLPTRADAGGDPAALRAEWAAKYGEDAAQFLMEAMDDWTRQYSHGALIEFDFTRALELDRRVREICAERGWAYEEIPGDLSLLQRWVDGDWDDEDFLIVRPGERIAPSWRENVVTTEAGE
jgi:hypothetical protein